MQRLLIAIGTVALVLGLLWPWLDRIPLGRLPGDLIVERGNFRLYLPVTSMVVVSALLTLVVWLWRR